jgi:5-methylcytosine-specific restriction protein A
VPYAPPSRCLDPDCSDWATNRGYCDDHQRPAWRDRDDKAARYGISAGRWRTLKAKVTRRDNGHCYMCGAPPPDDPETPGHELDHIVPVAEGGAREDLDNLGLACVTCHTEKSAEEAARGSARRRAQRKAERHT